MGSIESIIGLLADSQAISSLSHLLGVLSSSLDF